MQGSEEHANMPRCSGVSFIYHNNTKYHTVEILKDYDAESRILRSVNCQKILSFNSIIKTCNICKHITFHDKTNNKENLNADSKASIYKLSDNNLKEKFRRLIRNASNNML
jgi:hypothetical protein